MTKKWTTFFIALIASLPAAAQTVRCPATADTWVSVPEDRRAEGVDNHGTDTQLPIRGRESLALFQFDVSGLKGRQIAKAVLKIHRENADPVPLDSVGVSTVSGTAAWAEGARKKGPAAPGESNYFFARVGQQPWSYPGSDVTDVTFGQGGSLYSYERARDAGNGWYEIDVPAGIVAALVSGDQFGIMLTDEKGQTHANHLIHSRESQYPPVLIVSSSGTEKVAPGPVQARPVETTPAEARRLGRTTLRPGSVILNFGGAGNAAHYEVRYSDVPITEANFDKAAPVARWMLNPLAPKPAVLATSNSLQDWVVAVVEQLKPAADYYFAARAVSAAGNAGPVSPLGRFQAYDRTYPALPPASELTQPSGTAAASAGALRVWAVPELLKIHPRTAELLEKDYANYRGSNPVWDASSDTVTLRGARNEFLAFQLAIESAAPFSGVEVSVSRPLFGTSRLPPIFKKDGAIQLSREWFVPEDKETGASREWYADALVPLKPLSIPSTDNPVPGQTVAPVFVDIYVPHDAAAGSHTGELLVRGAGFEKRIRIQVQVLPLTLPDKLNFDVDLMTYTAVPSPAGMERGTPEYRALVRGYHRVAHLNRANLNVLGYTQWGTVAPDQAPMLEGEGAATRASSWQDWDAHFGPMLDGSAFKDLPRSGVPVQAIFLPFFENWPGNLRKGYRFNYPDEIWSMKEYDELLIQHALKAGPIEEAFSKDYQDRFSAVASEFARHIKERGWLATDYIIYLNNKYYFKRPGGEGLGRGSSLWLLDEPNHRDDNLALSFFFSLAKRGLEKYPDVPIRLRADISRVEWTRDLLAGQIDIECVSGKLFSKNRYLMDDRIRFGRKFWNYATTNHPRETNVAMRAWCLRAWASGADAVVPWEAAAGSKAWERAEQLTVFYPGDKFGQLEPLPSLRLKAYRRGQQDVEYLVMLANKQGWDREAVSEAVFKGLDLSGGIEQSYDEDAGSINFQHVKDEQMDALRLRVAKALLEK
jgi:hypothetical protein